LREFFQKIVRKVKLLHTNFWHAFVNWMKRRMKPAIKDRTLHQWYIYFVIEFVDKKKINSIIRK